MSISNSIRPLFYAGLAILGIAFYSYFLNYHYPAALAWDENYHIAAAEKYLHGVMFMEPHPPLGKLLIASGEWLLDPNQYLDTSSFLHTDYIKTIPDGYSFIGVRFFPVLFACFSAVLFFLILYQLSRHLITAILFSSLYLFENAMIVHSRTAMLESLQIFFIFAAIGYFLYRLDKPPNCSRHYFLLGILVGLATAVKLNSLILLFLFPGMWFYRNSLKTTVENLIKLLNTGSSFLLGLLSMFLLSYYLHFALGQNVLTKSYEASPEYLQILENKSMLNPLNFLTMFKDNLYYIKKYEQGVPLQHEPGSSPGTWAFGNKAINYRSERDKDKIHYLYLQGNPLIWLLVIIGVILSLVQIIAYLFFRLKIKRDKNFYLISLFTFMYLAYLAVMFNLGRVMYLYHYLIPLFFGTFLFYLQFHQFLGEKLKKNPYPIYWGIIILVAEILFCYFYFSPLTYYHPLSTEEFMQRQWVDFWHLKMLR